MAASYADEFGVLTSRSETLPNGWTTPSRSNGRDGVRADGETGRSWMAVRAYDPSVGRFISRDPLGRAPLCFADQPYAYAGNNPLVNVDPSGQRRQMLDGGDWVTAAPATHTAHWGRHARILTVPGTIRPGPCGKDKWCWAHKYSDGEFGDGLWSALAGAVIIGSVVMGYFQGVGPLLDMLFHSQLLTAIHWLVRGVQEMWEGINGPLTSRDRVWFDIAVLLGDVAVFVLGLIDGWRAFTGVKIGKYAGQGTWVRLQRIFLKLKNFIQHGLNVDALKPLLGDIGALIGGIPTMIKDWNTFARDARSAWGWNLERMPCTNVICS